MKELLCTSLLCIICALSFAQPSSRELKKDFIKDPFIGQAVSINKTKGSYNVLWRVLTIYSLVVYSNDLDEGKMVIIPLGTIDGSIEKLEDLVASHKKGASLERSGFTLEYGNARSYIIPMPDTQGEYHLSLKSLKSFIKTLEKKQGKQ